MLYGPNTNVGSNSVIFMLEAQARYIVRALKYMRRKGKSLRRGATRRAGRLHRQDRRWMVGTVWTTQCSNYFRAPNGRVVTQWPRSARAFWSMTRRFRPGRLPFTAARHGGAPRRHRCGAGRAVTELDGADRLDPALRDVATTRTEFSSAAIQLIRGPFNERRRRPPSRPMRHGVRIVEDACQRNQRCPTVRIYRGGPRTGTGRGVLPRGRIRARQPGHRSSAMR